MASSAHFESEKKSGHLLSIQRNVRERKIRVREIKNYILLISCAMGKANLFRAGSKLMSEMDLFYTKNK